MNPVGTTSTGTSLVAAASFSIDQRVKLALTMAAAAIADCGVLMGLNRELAGPDVTAANNPVAAVAWAQANCYRGLALNEPAARTEAEVLLEVAAGFESQRNRQGIKSACSNALRLGKRAIDPKSMPSYTGEQPRYDDQPEIAVAN